MGNALIRIDKRQTNSIIAKSIIITNIFLLSIIIRYLFTIPPAKGYEVSIYLVYPSAFWSAIVLIFVLSTILIMATNSRLYWLLGIAILVLTLTMLYSIPLVREYFIYDRADGLEHIGRVRDILNTGHLGEENLYPILHILIATLNYSSGILIETSTMYLPPLFSVLFWIGYILFVSRVLRDKDKIEDFRIIWVIALLPIFGIWNFNMVPNIFSFFIIPLLLYVWTRKPLNPAKKVLLATIILLGIEFFHPLTFIWSLLVMLSLDITYFLVSTKDKKEYIYFYSKSSIVLITLMLFVYWYFSFRQIQYGLNNFLHTLLGQETVNEYLNMYLSNKNKYHLTYLEITRFIVYKYGIMIILSGLTLLIFFNDITRKKRALDWKTQFFITFQIVGILMFIGIISIVITTKFVSFERLFRYLIFFSMPSIAIAMNRVKITQNKKALCGMLVIILGISYLSVFGLYLSPLTGDVNKQTTKQEYEGMKWFLTNRNQNILAYEQKVSQLRLAEAIYGYTIARKIKNLQHWKVAEIKDHYGYNSNNPITHTDKDIYLLISIVGKIYYQYLIPDHKEYWRWTIDDIHHLYSDPSSNRVYSTPEFEVLLILGER